MQKKLLRLHAKLCEELNIPRAKVVFRGFSRRGIPCTGYYDIRKQTIFLYTKNIALAGRDPRTTLTHETRHHAQTVWGWLTTTEYRGKSMEKFEGIKPRDCPWEVDAYGWTDLISKREGWWTT